MTGHTTYRYLGYRIHVTPWVRPYMTGEMVGAIAEALASTPELEATVSAQSAGGPFHAIVGGQHGHGRTALVAVRVAAGKAHLLAELHAEVKA